MKECRESRLVSSLERLRDKKDRAALAKLRRGLGKKEGSPEMYPYVADYLGESRWEAERNLLLAALFGFHPDRALRGKSMGKVFREIKGEGDASDSLKKRFANLLSADREDLPGRLRQAVSLAKSKGVAVDYHQLFYDLRAWSHSERYVQLRWARDFWGYQKEADQQPDDEMKQKGDKQ